MFLVGCLPQIILGMGKLNVALDKDGRSSYTIYQKGKLVK